jgi:hypothetical protein
MVLTRVQVVVVIVSCGFMGLGLVCFILGFLYKWWQVSRREAERKHEPVLGWA